MSAPSVGRTLISDANLEASPEAMVWLMGKTPIWPTSCACCLGPADRTKAFDVLGGPGITPYPVCDLCRRHAMGSDIIASAALLGALAVVGGGYYAIFGTAVLKNALWLTGMVLLIGIGVVGFALHMFLNRWLLATTPACASTESPVARLAPPFNEANQKEDHETESSYADRMRCVKHLERTRAAGEEYLQLSFTNREYARRFVQANSGD